MTDAPDRRPIAVFRADAGGALGTGHVRRCLALAGALAAEGWRCGFACRRGAAAAVPELAGAGVAVNWLDEDEADTPEALAARWPGGADLLIADQYGLDAGYERGARPWARRVMAIDDLADRPHDCELLLDATPGRPPDAYRGLVPEGCRMLTGPDHALLRPDFARRRLLARGPHDGRVRRVLVAPGGTDSAGLGPLMLRAIRRSGLELALDVMIGGSAGNLDEIRREAAGIAGARVHADADDPAALTAAADLVLGAGGSSSWERCCLGVPALVAIAADNQRPGTEALAAAGAVEVLGDVGSLDPEGIAERLRAAAADPARVAAMAVAALELCDGLGAARAAIAVAGAPLAKDGALVGLRRATRNDAATLLGWQRDPETRRHARNPDAPTEDEHRAWLGAKLADPGCALHLIDHGGVPAGTVRLDRRGAGGLEVSIAVAPDRHRLGIGQAALEVLRRLVPWAELWAEVLPGNRASHRLFEAAGYEPAGKGWYRAAPIADPAELRMDAGLAV